MSQHIAIAVGADELRGLWIKSGLVRWHARAELAGVATMHDSVRALVSLAPRALARARVTVVLSPHWVQTKQLHGLPALGSPRLATQLLRENEQAFFLWKGRPSVIVAQFGRAGPTWASAFDADCVDELVRALRSARFRIVELAPAVATVAAAFPGQTIHWSDGERRFRIEGDREGLVKLERVTDSHAAEPVPELLGPIGPGAEQCIDVYAAATLRRRLPLAWRPQAEPERLRRRRRMIDAATGFALAAAASAAALAPGLRAAGTLRRAEHELRRLAVVQRELASTQSELRRIDDALGRIARATVDRGRVTQILGALSRVLPESTAMLDIRLDSAEGAFTAIAPSVADVVPALAAVGGIAAPQIIGSVTRETIAGVRLERAAFRFRRPRDARERPR